MRQPRARLLLGFVLLLALLGCQQTAPETVVVNESQREFIVGAIDYLGERYYAIPPGSSVPIDTIGHHNPPPDAVVIYDSACRTVPPLQLTSVSLSGGGVIRIGPDESFTFEAGRVGVVRPGEPLPEDRGEPSCEDAAATL